jgi:hypothetical protein
MRRKHRPHVSEVTNGLRLLDFEGVHTFRSHIERGPGVLE